MKHGAPVPLHGTTLDVVLACRHANNSTRNLTDMKKKTQELLFVGASAGMPGCCRCWWANMLRSWMDEGGLPLQIHSVHVHLSNG